MHQHKKKILVVIPTLRAGGSEKVIVTILKNLDEQRFEIKLAVFDLSDSVFLDQLPPGIKIIDLDSQKIRFGIIKAAKIIYRWRPDVVFSTLGHLNLMLSIVKGFFPRNTRLVARESSIVSEMIKTYRLPILWRLAVKLFYPRIDLLICQSEAMKIDLVTRFKFPEEKINVIHNPVELVKIREKRNELESSSGFHRNGLSLVAAGRLSREKGFELLIEAIALLGNKDISLTILGDGPMKESLLERARELGVADQVQLVGYVSDPISEFIKADLFVMSSFFEGFPNVLLEALSSGTPVVSVPTKGGVEEIIKDIPDAIVADEISAAALSRSIEIWIGRPSCRVDEGYVKKYSIEQIMPKFEAVLGN